MKSLFNETVPDYYVKPKAFGHYKTFRAKNYYRKSISPNERSCKLCINFIEKRFNGKSYFKCWLQGDSNCHSSDIRKSYVCNKFRKQD